MSFHKYATFAAISFMSVAAVSATAFALPASGASSKPNATDGMTKTPTKKSPKALKCKRSETSKRVIRKGKRLRICVKLKAEILPDAELYQNARLLADDGEYEWALDHLRLMSNQNDAEVLNYTGYSNRKAGRLETGISYYHRALAINPNYVQAREYLGEAYVLAGRVDLAQVQLTEIANRCGVSCETYRALSAAIMAPTN
jgi:tetratricopeptide (TPR) repeat protein